MRHLDLKTIGLTAAVVVLALGAGAAIGGERAKATKQATAGDHGLDANAYFSPENLNVHKGDKVHWTWAGSRPHSVYLNKSPSGVHKGDFRTSVHFAPYDFTSPAFRKVGTYKFICTQHSAIMRMKVVVKR